MANGKIVSLEDRVPKLKQHRRKKANKRLILLLLLFFTLIAFVTYFQSPLSKVKYIEVSGQSKYSEEQVIQKSGLTTKQNIWNINEADITERIKSLPEVKKVKVIIQLPNTVKITIQEYKQIAYFSKEKNFYPVLESGRILKEQELSQLPVSAPILKEFSEGKALNEMIINLKKLPPEVVNSISEIHHTPKETDIYHITLYMNDGFEVSATLRTFAEKMLHYPSIISQLNPNIKGVIDLEVGSYFKAYESEGEEQLENEGER